MADNFSERLARLEAHLDEVTQNMPLGESGVNAELLAQLEAVLAELRRSETRFAQIFRLGPVAATLVTRPEAHFLDVNHSFEALTGYERDQVVGRRPSDLDMWASSEDQALLRASLNEAEGYRDLSLRLLTKSGEARDILASATVLKLDGEEALLQMFYDVTERKRTEDELRRAVDEVMSDTSWFSGRVLEKLAEFRTPEADPGQLADLTPRERQVLERLAAGASNAEIAAELGLALNTVRNYISGIYDKAGVSSRVGAVLWARERGLG